MPDSNRFENDEVVAAWLSPHTLLVVARDLNGSDEARASVSSPDASSVAVESQAFTMAWPGGEPATGGAAWVAFGERTAWGPDHTLNIEAGESSFRIDHGALRQAMVEIPALVRRYFAPLHADARTGLLGFLARSLGTAPPAERYDLSERLHGLRQALRERLPAAVVAPEKRRGVHVDRIMLVDDRSMFIDGWMHLEGTEASRMTAVSPEGSRAELLPGLQRFPRSDVAQSLNLGGGRMNEEVGFAAWFELDAPTLREEGWILEIEDQRGAAEELRLPHVMTEVIDVREGILGLVVERLIDEDLIAGHLLPAITRIQERVSRGLEIESVVQHGRSPANPDVSIVIPLYRNIEHIEIQFSQFADDPEISRAELIYVLDSPEDDLRLRRYAAEVYPVYGIPFKVATMNRNAGFAGATNAGAELAGGRLLLLMNSDVLPDQPGWLGRMRDFYDATPNIGALGPKMLYEDDSIQHAGMYFLPYNDPKLSVWVDATYYKGMHRSIPAANIARPVPVVSGGCMMIDRELFRELGMFQRMYVRGDYEDSHLCLSLLDRGRENWYLPEAELYHLEGQSYTSEARRASNSFNRWLHTRVWRERMESLMESEDESRNGGSPGIG